QPFCDGSHAGTAFTPEKLVLDEKKRVALCRCKRTGNSPFCDGTHSQLQAEAGTRGASRSASGSGR
ncbi:MAG: CDGSH iron-sulfur domain-containing protein, partial [Acidobacteria bacterium]|nr:CDGSH iron-sulfur domain-containing protein [Acidobacteriota bacterium]